MTRRTRIARPIELIEQEFILDHANVRPVRLTLVPNTNTGPTLSFKRSRPRMTWVVPPVTIPLYLFDSQMARRRLILRIGNVFVCDGHRFHILGKFVDRQYRRSGPLTRWIVYREDASLPNGGAPDV
jgi:hypothetical protein